jgi:hypothetical protein
VCGCVYTCVCVCVCVCVFVFVCVCVHVCVSCVCVSWEFLGGDTVSLNDIETQVSGVSAVRGKETYYRGKRDL